MAGEARRVKGAPIWRYSENPIIGRNPIEGVARIFNSAVMPYEDGFIGVFRGEQTNGIPYIYLGINGFPSSSTNGILFESNSQLLLMCINANIFTPLRILLIYWDMTATR